MVKGLELLVVPVKSPVMIVDSCIELHVVSLEFGQVGVECSDFSGQLFDVASQRAEHRVFKK